MPEQRIGNSLLALSSAAVLAVYAAGYVRTRAAAERFAAQTEARVRPVFAERAAAGKPNPAEPTHDIGTPAVTTTHEPIRPRRRKTVELVAPSSALHVTEDKARYSTVSPPSAPSAPAPSTPAASAPSVPRS